MEEKTKGLLNAKYFPMFKFEHGDNYYFRDVDSEHLVGSEELDLLRITKFSSILIKETVDSEWKKLDVSLGGDILEAIVSFRKIRENYKMWRAEYIEKELIMFKYQDVMFKNPYVIFDQLAVAGDPIERDKFYEDRVKVDFLNSYVFTYEKGTLVSHQGQLYLDGVLIYSRQDLINLNLKVDSFNKEIEIFVKDNIPNAKRYAFPWEYGGIKHE